MANRWTRARKDEFLEFYDTHGVDATAAEFNLKDNSVQFYVHRFRQHKGLAFKVESSVDSLNEYTEALVARIKELEAEVLLLKQT